MGRVLTARFFERDATDVAPDLLGKLLVRRRRGREVRWRIREVEAYHGLEDRASHAHRGRTARNAPMFGPPGVWYVYLVYGLHWMLNVVTGTEGVPSAVLIRAAGEARTPGVLTARLSVDGRLNDRPASPESGLWVEDGPPPGRVVRTARIGVDYAGRRWASTKRRFLERSDLPEPRRPRSRRAT